MNGSVGIAVAAVVEAVAVEAVIAVEAAVVVDAEWGSAGAGDTHTEVLVLGPGTTADKGRGRGPNLKGGLGSSGRFEEEGWDIVSEIVANPLEWSFPSNEEDFMPFGFS